MNQAPPREVLGRLRDARNEKALAAAIASASDEELRDCVEPMAGDVLADLRSDSHEALKHAERLAEVARASKDRLAIARACWVRGHALGELLRLDEALRSYSEAEKIYRAEGASHQAARVRLGQINVLRKAGRDRLALRRGEEARRELLRHGDRLAAVRLDANLAAILHHHERRVDALRIYDRALRLARRAEEKPIERVLQFNRATVLGHLGRLQEAREIYAALRAEIDPRREARLVGIIDHGLGSVARLAGDYELAHRHLSVARDRFEEADDPDYLLQTELELAALRLEVGSGQRALSLAQLAIESARRHSMLKEEAKGRLLAGMALLAMGRLDEAEEALTRARDPLLAVSLPVSSAVCTVQLAEIAARHGRQDLARTHLHRAEKVLTDEGVRPLRIDVLLRLGWLELGASQFEECASTLKGARRLLRSLASSDLSANAAHLAGRKAEAEGRIDVARREYRRAVAELERTRDRIDSDELRLSYAAGRSGVFDDLIRLLVGRGTRAAVREAYLLVERARVRSWVEEVGSRLSPRRLARSDRALRLGERIESLRSSLRSLRGRHRDLDSRQRPAVGWQELRRTIQRQEAELADLHQRLERAESSGASLRVGTALSAEETCRRLPENVALIAYHIAEPSSFAFVLDRKEVRGFDLGIGATALQRDVSRLRFHLEKWTYGEDYIDERAEVMRTGLARHLERLARTLWEPLGIDAGEVWVIPHGPLYGLPFEALPLGEPRSSGKAVPPGIPSPPGKAVPPGIPSPPGKAVPPGIPSPPGKSVPPGHPSRVIDRYRVVRLSGGGFRRGRSTRLAPKELLQAWPTGGDGKVHGSALVVGVDQPELPHLRRELRAVRGTLSAPSVLRNRRATRERVASACEEADLVHIATHGVYRADDPFFSALELGDGWLSLYDVYRLRLRARLVTLSACPVAGPAFGREHGGIARGLLHAGARSLLLSLWSVDDQTTARFMGHFYRNLGRGRSSSDALRAAMTEIRRRHPDPYYWAPFALYGSCAE